MKQALLVIDCIKGVIETGTCASYLAENAYVISNINALIKTARSKDLPIIHIRLAFSADYQGLPQYAPSASMIQTNKKFLLGSPDTEFIGSIDLAQNDHILNKKYGNPFHHSDLAELLRKLQIEGVILAGFATDNAILYGAEEAMINNYHVIVITDACGAPSISAHENALAIMQHRTVNEFLTTEEFCHQLDTP